MVEIPTLNKSWCHFPHTRKAIKSVALAIQLWWPITLKWKNNEVVPWERRCQLQGGGGTANLLFGQIFPENYITMKIFWTRGRPKFYYVDRSATETLRGYTLRSQIKKFLFAPRPYDSNGLKLFLNFCRSEVTMPTHRLYKSILFVVKPHNINK